MESYNDINLICEWGTDLQISTVNFTITDQDNSNIDKTFKWFKGVILIFKDLFQIYLIDEASSVFSLRIR